MSQLRKQLNHRVHNEHKERHANLLVVFVSFVNFVVKTKWRWVARTKPSLSCLWFNQNGIRIAASSKAKTRPDDRVQEIVHHPLASSCTACHELCRMEPRRSVASCCSKLRQCVTPRVQQPAGHRRFLPLMAIFGPKKCARGCQRNRKSTESTFGSRFPRESNFPRVVQNTFGSERLHFIVQNSFLHAHNDFQQPHLTPMITSQNSPHNQISKARDWRSRQRETMAENATGILDRIRGRLKETTL
jgi:hypothetical protein